MKRRVFCALLVLILLLSACSQSAAATWREQYDLGVRYLSEGNYQEAILAFAAAIEIDPKQADAYIGLADAYVAQGDTEQARRVLADALAVVADPGAVQSRLDVLEESAAPEPTPTPAPTLEPAPAPTPSSAVNEFGGTEFTARDDYRVFEDYTSDEQRFITSMAAAAVAGDTDTMRSLLGPKISAYTIWNGYKVYIYGSGEGTTDYGDRSISASVQLRPENGTGYYYRVQCIDAVATLVEDSWSDAVFIEQIICPCEDWQWNGAMEYIYSYYHYQKWKDGSTCDVSEITRTAGTMANSLRDGMFVSENHRTSVWSKWTDLNEDTLTSNTCVYRDGVLIEEDGQPVEEGRVYALLYDYATVLDNLDSIYW